MKNKTLKTIICALAFSAIVCSSAFSQNNDRSKVFNPLTDKVDVNHEFRGAWLTTVRGSDWPRKIRVNLSRLKGESRHEQKIRIER